VLERTRMKIISILVFLFVCSCSCESQHGLIGTWKVKNYTLWEKGAAFLNGVRGLELGHELTLNSDSSYKEQSCGNIWKGKWWQSGDSLILNSDTMWYRSVKWYRENRDSNYDSIAGIISHSRRTFFIEKNRLVKIDKEERYTTDNGSIKILKGHSMTILK
jgi:hypothetical protein